VTKANQKYRDTTMVSRCDFYKLTPTINYLEVKTTGRIALYCSSDVVAEAKKTFLSALNSKESLDAFISSKASSKLQFQNRPSKKSGLKSKTLPNEKHSQSFSNGNVKLTSLNNPQIRSNSTILQKNVYPSYSRSKSRQDMYSDEGIASNYDEKVTRPSAPRTRFVNSTDILSYDMSASTKVKMFLR